MRDRSLSLFRRSICLGLIVVSSIISLLFLFAQIRLMGFEVMRDYGEGHTLWMSKQIINLANAYKPIDDLPYIIYPYPPLYLLVSKWLSLLVGNLLMAGRIVSLSSTLGLAAIIGLLIFRSISASFPRIWRIAGAVLGAALILSTGSVFGWASLMRVDMLGLMLMYGGMAVYILGGKRETWQYVAIFLFFLAAFTKQTLLSAPIACGIFGLFVYPKTTIRVYGVAVLLGVTGLFACHWLTHGGFLKNIVSYNLNPFSRDVMFMQLSDHMGLNMILKLGISLAALLGLWHGKSVRRLGLKRFFYQKSGKIYSRTVLIGGLNACFAFLLALSIGKMGSIYNFFLAWDVSLCLLTVFYLFRLLATRRSTYTGTVVTQISLAILLIFLFIPSKWTIAVATEDFTIQANQEAQLIKKIQETPGPVLSDNMFIVYKAGRNVEVEPATLSFLTRAGGWDERPYVQLFERQYFRLIISTPLESTADRYSPAVILAIKKNYQLDGQIGGYLIYRPRVL